MTMIIALAIGFVIGILLLLGMALFDDWQSGRRGY